MLMRNLSRKSITQMPHAPQINHSIQTLLAISASTSVCSVLLTTPAQQYQWQTTQNNQHSEQLLPAIHSLLAQAGLSRVDCIAVDNGPGAFTSVRVACAVAQGLALGWGCGVLMVESLTALAYQYSMLSSTPCLTDTHLLVLLDARMNECYAASYHLSATNDLVQTMAPCLVPYDLKGFESVCEQAQIIGNMANTIPNWPCLGVGQTAAQPSAMGVFLAATAQLAQAVLPALPEHVQPLYIRNQVAFTTAERLAQLTPILG
jgi:tRNA threonylcarbamoyladenosine biosynthesis protein TsaB